MKKRKSKVIVLLQARVNSERFYFKSLCPINKISLVELCIKRTFSKKYLYCVLIPDTKENDLLAEIIKKNNLNLYRGSEKNVFSRFNDFLKSKNKEDIIIRITADNPLVDSIFIDECIRIFRKNSLKYFSSHYNIKNIIYGLSVEVFYLKYLREFDHHNMSDKNKEHVTYDLKKKYLSNLKVNNKYLLENKKKYRVSVDRISDYLIVKHIFKDSINLPYYKYIKNILNYKKKNNDIKNKSKVVIGSVQIGKKYFSDHQISQKRANTILARAYSKNINFIDTANDYGKSEVYIGNYLKKNKNVNFFVSTKISSFDKIKNPIKIKKKLIENISRSLVNLNKNILDYVFIHDPKDLKKNFLLDELIKYKKTGLIKKLGISIYNLKDLKYLQENIFDAVQIPFNLFDHRFLNFILKNKRYEIFIRSILLRGNIEKKNIILPENKYNYLLKKLRFFMKKNKYKNYFELSFAFIKYLKNINFYVIGFQSGSQLSLVDYINKSIAMKSKDFFNIVSLIKSSGIEKDIDLRFW